MSRGKQREMKRGRGEEKKRRLSSFPLPLFSFSHFRDVSLLLSFYIWPLRLRLRRVGCKYREDSAAVIFTAKKMRMLFEIVIRIVFENKPSFAFNHFLREN